MFSQIIINKEPGPHDRIHYNMENSPEKKEVWDVKRLLEVKIRDTTQANILKVDNKGKKYR